MAPFVFLFIFASFEFGRAMMAIHTLEGAAHDGCRAALVNGATVADVNTAVTSVMNPAGITQFQTTVTPPSLATVNQWDPISVSVTTTYGDISWLPVPKYLGSITLRGGSTLPREADSP